MDKIRTFIAVELPAVTRRRLAEVEKKLMASGADVKWVPEQNFHVTLKFLGYVEPHRVDPVMAATKAAIADVRPFDVTLFGAGAFPKPARPSVIWVGVTQGAEELKDLAERVESAMESVGFAREARAFSSHITVGRVRAPKNLDRLKELIEELREEPVDTFRVGGVAVMKSDLRPTGPIYTPLAEIEFGKC
jgi:2'-5' RNA ligase